MKNFWKYLLASIIGALIALGLIVFILTSIIGSAMSNFDKSRKASVSVPAGAVLKIDFSSALAEQDDENPMAGVIPAVIGGGDQNSIGILKAIRAIQEAENDPNIKMIYVNTDNLSGGISHIEELRNALKHFREESGKPVVTYAQNYTNAGYYLASVSDKIMMNKFGSSEINGLASSMMFYKDLLDKLGVKIQLIRHGKYKSAGEPYIANTISDANREMTQEMINSIWSSIIGEVSESRDIPADSLNAYIDNLELLDAQSMLDRKMIDQVAYKDELEEYFCTLTGAKKPSELKVISLDDYANAKVTPNLGAKTKIAVIYANGEISSGSSEDQITDGNFCKIIRKVRADSSIKAVVFRVNSPGGSAMAAENIRREIFLLKEVKPVVASYGDYAASGGYWISAGCDTIFTDKTTLTGSIGVYSIVPDAEGLLNDKAHVHNVIVSSNKHGGMGSIYHPLAPEENAYMQRGVEMIYDQFLQLVSESRDMDVAQVDSLAQGRVWPGADAIQNGLADVEGGIVDAIGCAADMAGLSGYRVEEFPQPKDAMSKIMSFFNNGDGSSESSIDLFRRLLMPYSVNQVDATSIMPGSAFTGQPGSSKSLLTVDPSRIFTDPNNIYARMEYVYLIQ
jgi:protease-4